MRTYCYKCTSCTQRVEVLRNEKDRARAMNCTTCGQPLVRDFSSERGENRVKNNELTTHFTGSDKSRVLSRKEYINEMNKQNALDGKEREAVGMLWG